ncbi:MAG: hypothetical protein IJP44_08150 [Bacteroidales bacterium]|nr:hypothetical protein [Bacteroidales bacterium]
MKKGLNIIINIVLFAVVVFLAMQVIKSIQAPIKFNKAQAERESQIVQRLIDIRNAEVFYKNANNKYTSSFDTLIDFCQTAEIPIVEIKPDPTDTTFTRTINDTLGFVKVVDSIRGRRENFNIKDLSIVPFSTPTEKFELEAGFIKRSGIDVPVFEARTPYEVYLKGLDQQRILNAKAEKESINRYAGLKVGSMEEASTDGNWEKL